MIAWPRGSRRPLSGLHPVSLLPRLVPDFRSSVPDLQDETLTSLAQTIIVEALPVPGGHADKRGELARHLEPDRI